MPKYARSGIRLARERGWTAGKNPMSLSILAWVLVTFCQEKVTGNGHLKLSQSDQTKTDFEKHPYSAAKQPAFYKHKIP